MKQLYIFVFAFVIIQHHILSQTVWKQFDGPFSGEISAFGNWGDTIFAGTTLSGIYKSVDDGESWSRLEPELASATSFYSLDSSLIIGSKTIRNYSNKIVSLGQPISGAAMSIVRHKNKLFACNDYGIYLYDPVENSWLEKVEGIELQSSLTWTRSLTTLGDDLFCSSSASGLYKSNDMGEHWEKVELGDHIYPSVAAIIVNNDTLIAQGSDTRNLFRSTDHGLSWQEISFNLPNASINSSTFWNDNLIISTNSGIYQLNNKTTDWTNLSNLDCQVVHSKGATLLAANQTGLYKWHQDSSRFLLSNRGINTARVLDIEIFEGKIYAANERGTFYTKDKGNSWTLISGFDDTYSTSLAKKDSLLYLGGGDGLFTISINNPLPQKVFSTVVWKIAQTENEIFVGTDDGVLYLDTISRDWTPLPNHVSPVLQMYLLAAAPGILVAGNSFGLYCYKQDSKEWEVVDFFKEKTIMAVSTIDQSVFVTAMNESIYRSDDQCKTWQLVSVPISNNFDIIKRGNNIYAANYEKIYFSKDNGITWDSWSETGTNDLIINTIFQGDSSFYIGTYGNSIWYRPYNNSTSVTLEELVLLDSTIVIPDSISTEQFDAQMEISYGASSNLVKLDASNKRIDHQYIVPGDRLYITAEDGKNKRSFTFVSIEEDDDPLVTAIKEESLGSALTIYPVPVSETLYLKSYKQIKSCQIYDITGNLKLVVPNGNAIDVSSLLNGLYILKVVREEKIDIVKFVKE